MRKGRHKKGSSDLSDTSNPCGTVHIFLSGNTPGHTTSILFTDIDTLLPKYPWDK